MHSDPLFSEFVALLQLYGISLSLIYLLTCSRLEYTEISLRIGNPFHCEGDFPGGTGGKESACHAGDAHSNFRFQEEICHCFHLFPSICHEVMGPDAMLLVFFNIEF